MTEAVDVPGSSTRRAVRYGMIPLLALATTTLLEAGERGSLSVAVDRLKEDFQLTDKAVGAIPFAMTIIGVLGAFPFGMLADRLRRTRLLAGAMLVWTSCMALNGLAPTYAFLFATRLGVGTVEANGPAAVSLIADYYPIEERSRRFGLYALGGLVGTIIGYVGGGIAIAVSGSWRWAFLFWIPAGLASVAFLLRQPEPKRGAQDASDHLETEMLASSTAAEFAAVLGRLPPPRRVGTLDYSRARMRDVLGELRLTPSMWFGVVALTVGQLLLFGIGFWAIAYFKRVHGLDEAQAGGLAATLALSSAIGIVGGGYLADRRLRRGHINARIHVAAVGSLIATALLIPAFLSTSLRVTVPLFIIGGVMLSLPIAPSEALITDVVVAELRGRAAAVRSVVRAASGSGAFLIGALSDAWGDNADSLRHAIVVFCPLYAVAGLLMLLAARHYASDVSFVLAESRRRLSAQTDEPDTLV